MASRHYLEIGLLVVLAGGCGQGANGRLREPTTREVQQLRYQMAESLVARREYETAAAYIHEQLQREPNSARLHLLLGIVLREKGVYAAAEREIRRSLALQPAAADAHAALGILLAKKRQYAAAEKSHRQALELAPKVAAYHNDLGFCLIMQRRYDAARDELEAAIQLDPTMRRAFNNLGLALGLLEEEEAALAAFSQAGSRAMALTNMGYVYELQGRRGQARRYYEKALRAQRGYAPALTNLRRLDPSRYEHLPAEGSEPAERNESVEEASDEPNEEQPVSVEPAPATGASSPMRDGATGGTGGHAAGARGQRLLQGAAPGRPND